MGKRVETYELQKKLFWVSGKILWPLKLIKCPQLRAVVKKLYTQLGSFIPKLQHQY